MKIQVSELIVAFMERLGSLGVTSSGWAYQYIIDQADLVLFLGAGFNERTSCLWDEKLLDQKKIVQVDNDPGQLEKVFYADLAVQGDIKQVLIQLLIQALLMPVLNWCSISSLRWRNIFLA